MGDYSDQAAMLLAAMKTVCVYDHRKTHARSRCTVCKRTTYAQVRTLQADVQRMTAITTTRNAHTDAAADFEAASASSMAALQVCVW